MTAPRNEEQEEAIQADLKRGEKFCLCPDCDAARQRLHAAGFRTCLVMLDVPGEPDPAIGVFTVARDDDEAKSRAVDFVRRRMPSVDPLIPVSVKWKP